MEPKQNEVMNVILPLKKVTPLSKYLAMVLFIFLPFVGGWIGYSLAPVEVVEAEKYITKMDTLIQTPIHNVHEHNLFKDLISDKEFSPKAALDELRESVFNDPDTEMVHCHEKAHIIGNHAYQLLGENAYQYADPMCGGGYLHGVTEQAFESNGLVYLQNIVHEQCAGDMLESCLHGVGHGIHQSTNNIESAVEICEQFSASGTDCYDGVFMDLFDTHGQSKEDLITATEAYSICESTLSAAKNSCYFYLPRIDTNAEAATVVQLCNSLQIKTGWAACANGSGVFFMKQTSGFSKEIAVQYCRLYRDENLKRLCVNGVEAYEKYGSAENTKWH